MSDQDYQNQFYNPQGQEAGYDMSSMPMDQQFGQFDYSQAASYEAPFVPEPAVQPQQSNPYAGSILTPATDTFNTFTPAPTGDSFEDEPPLMEELGINFDHIMQKTLAVLNPLREPDTSSLQDTDMAGPLVFCLAFGGCLLLVGKLQFGYIYGIGVVGCLAMYTLLNLMSMTGVAVSCIVSVLGYCLLPMVLLSSLAVLISLKGVLGVVMTTVAVLWCSVSASKLFVTALAMDQQQLLVAYPCALVYGVFALLTVF